MYVERMDEYRLAQKGVNCGSKCMDIEGGYERDRGQAEWMV